MKPVEREIEMGGKDIATPTAILALALSTIGASVATAQDNAPELTLTDKKVTDFIQGGYRVASATMLMGSAMLLLQSEDGLVLCTMRLSDDKKTMATTGCWSTPE